MPATVFFIWPDDLLCHYYPKTRNLKVWGSTSYSKLSSWSFCFLALKQRSPPVSPSSDTLTLWHCISLSSGTRVTLQFPQLWQLEALCEEAGSSQTGWRQQGWLDVQSGVLKSVVFSAFWCLSCVCRTSLFSAWCSPPTVEMSLPWEGMLPSSLILFFFFGARLCQQRKSFDLEPLDTSTKATQHYCHFDD